MHLNRAGRALRALAVAPFLAAGLLVAPLAGPPPVAGVGPLPDCRLDDILTEPRGYDDWEITLVDWILTLGPSYRPPDLVSVSEANVAGGGMIREVAIDDLRAMAAAARKNGTPIKVLSPFRGYRQQVELFYSYAGRDLSNFESAITFSARPGHSEHQTGLTIDFGAVGDTGLTSNWEDTPAGAWMAENAWKFGWLMSYPKGAKAQACYRYEPWHYRYVGREMAAKIRESGLTIREYLWANHTQLDPACVALPGPEPDTPGVPRSCPLAEPSPSPSPTPTPAVPTPTLPPTLPVPTASPVETPAATPPASPAGWLGLDPPVALTAGLLVVALLALLGSLFMARRSRRRRQVIGSYVGGRR